MVSAGKSNRKADDDAKQKALKALGDEQEESSGSGLLGSLLGGSGSGNGIVDNLIGLLTGKREMPEGGEGEVTELKAVDPDKK